MGNNLCDIPYLTYNIYITGNCGYFILLPPSCDESDKNLQNFKAKGLFFPPSSLFFLFSFIGQLIHLEARWDVRAGHGSIDQEVYLPFVCVCVFSHTIVHIQEVWQGAFY